MHTMYATMFFSPCFFRCKAKNRTGFVAFFLKQFSSHTNVHFKFKVKWTSQFTCTCIIWVFLFCFFVFVLLSLFILESNHKHLSVWFFFFVCFVYFWGFFSNRLWCITWNIFSNLFLLRKNKLAHYLKPYLSCC